MSIIGILIIIFQIAFCVHVIKRGHDLFWILIIILFPIIGGIIYFIVAVLPDIRNSRSLQKTGKKVSHTLKPNQKLDQHVHDLMTADTVDNKTRLAQEFMLKGKYDDAISLYQDCLKGIYEYEPAIMLGLAKAFFHQSNFQACKETLDVLIKENPGFKSQEGHLLYARSVEALGETENAHEEYEALIQYFVGLEAKCRYGLFLEKQGNPQSSVLFEGIIEESQNLSRHLLAENKQWINIAKKKSAF